jgi:16S rRNA pseudouridine516 synthase
MFAAVGNHVTALHRRAVGALTLGELAEGEWRVLDEGDIERVFAARADT